MSPPAAARGASRVLTMLSSAMLLWSTLWIASASAQTMSPKKSAADYFVSRLPGAPLPLRRMHAGHIEVSPEHHGNLFFWHFANRHTGDKERTVIWLNGGPGCSSLDGAMMEIGPYRIDGTNLRLQNGSWDEYANLLFVDQPVGTGYSFADTNSYVRDLEHMASDMVTFLQYFFEIFPEYSTNDLYIAGESYAGQYIPYIAKAILDRNKKAPKKWNLAGLLIGNGWVDPDEQYKAYLPFAYKANLIQSGTPIAGKMEQQQLKCLEALSGDGKNKISVRACELVLSELLRLTHEKPEMDGKCYNMYDLRKTDTFNSCGMNWPEDLPLVRPYLQRKDVADALHISPDKQTGWQECNGKVGDALDQTKSSPSVQLLPAILAEVPVMLFSGDKDLICNHLGTETMINKLAFNNGTGFEVTPGVTAPKLDWSFAGEPAGTYQFARNLTYVLFYNSSHMVPYDLPERSRDMLDRFMGVDYAVAGGRPPKDSAIDGQAQQRNATAEAEARLQQARWNAYYRSGEVALVVVLAALALWLWFLLRSRRAAGYKGLFDSDEPRSPGMGLLRPGSAVTAKRHGHGHGPGRGHGHSQSRDLEAADFDEAELDELDPRGGRYADREEERFDVGDDSEDDAPAKGANAGANGGANANGHR